MDWQIKMAQRAIARKLANQLVATIPEKEVAEVAKLQQEARDAKWAFEHKLRAVVATLPKH